MVARKAVADSLGPACTKQLDDIESSLLPVKSVNIVSAICTHIECLATQEKLIELGEGFRNCYTDVFLKIPHANDLPKDIYMRIKLKDALKTITTQSYSTP